ncbi:hypothetical protein LCGC14_2555490 [marine sediment metagenome]|uniref:Uncharacterized protein n=1 Tax=marine sediment metagenome TaxID=412755 RepID=A0A0F9CXU9_9ZZZZ
MPLFDDIVSKIKGVDDKGKIVEFKDGKRYSINKLHGLLKQHKSGEFVTISDKDLKTNGDAVEFYKSQLAILDLFKEYERRGNNIQNLQNIINSNSKGTGKTLSETHIKADEIYRLTESKVFHNADQLIGEYISQTKYNNLKEKLLGVYENGW